MTATLESSLSLGVLHLEFTSADGRNTMDDAWLERLDQALAQASDDAGVRSVLLSGRGVAFCSGMNLKTLKGSALTQSFSGSPLERLTRRLSRFEKPLLASVHGSAIGGGATLLLHCDLVVAARTTKFRLPFAALGIVPEFGSSYLLPRMAGARLASELFLLGRMFDASVAQRAGFVNTLTEPGEEFTLVREWAEHLAALPPAAVRMSKQLVREARSADINQAITREGAESVAAMGRGEVHEAVAAFIEKRAPDFSPFY